MTTKNKSDKTALKDPLRTIPDAADRLSLETSTIRSWVWQRRIESVRIGRAVRIRQSVIDAVIEKGTIPADKRVAVA